MMNYLTFAGKSTADFGVLISGESTFDTPERNVTVQEIAGIPCIDVTNPMKSVASLSLSFEVEE